MKKGVYKRNLLVPFLKILKESTNFTSKPGELNLSILQNLSHKQIPPIPVINTSEKCPRLTEPTLKATPTTLLVAATPASRAPITTPTPTEATTTAMTTAPLTTPPPAEAPLTLLLLVALVVAVAESNQVAVGCS